MGHMGKRGDPKAKTTGNIGFSTFSLFFEANKNYANLRCALAPD
jgi:hypothetical protein